ncbi:MarC family protein [Desulfovibrio inopinatus]|uniref:MarC family protein n=1 Tax=Desulfovibrio inopinatus TaxID=102109 RepID=UPI0004208DE6|nr:MarC family protein [Desulfovibrio inopinatus]
MVTLFTQVYLKFFFLLTPFFAISTFLAMTSEYNPSARRRLAVKVTGAVVIITIGLFLFGSSIFKIFGITLDAFRIGAGSLLFLSAVSLVQGSRKNPMEDKTDDIAVVPLALPVTVGPATTGALLVMAADMQTIGQMTTASAALIGACLTVGTLLYMAGAIEQILGQRGLVIMSKLTGLILASIAAQLVFTGVHNFMAQ